MITKTQLYINQEYFKNIDLITKLEEQIRELRYKNLDLQELFRETVKWTLRKINN